MAQGYVRCHYISPDGFECDSWIPSIDGENHELCAVHASALSLPMASNGVNKDSYISKRNAAQFSLLAATEGMSVSDKLAYYDQHIAGIEKIIEEQKMLVLTARALKQTELEGLTEAERAERRKIRTPKIERAEKPNAAKSLGKELIAKEKAIANIISQRKVLGKETSREQALAIFEMD